MEEAMTACLSSVSENCQLARSEIETGQVPELPTTELIADVQQPADAISRPLNVTDALSYLDAVKTQFSEKPDVYNNFLDIMKDFKSQVIDTPGVIERVSTLFHGHNDLIQGFNTFLPPGYRIECSGGSMESTTITVTTPTGTTTQSTDGLPTQPPFGISSSASPMPSQHSAAAAVPGLVMSSQPASPGITSASPMPYGTSSAADTLGGMGRTDMQDRSRQGPAGAQEFHHAIQYVNKIKTRFEDDPDTYKVFLDILHSYRRDQNHDEVYLQVQTLFRDAPDLLAEFKNFLPGDGGSAPFTSDAIDSWSDAVKEKKTEPAVAPKRKKRPVEKEIQPAVAAASTPKVSTSRTKKSKLNHVKENIVDAASYRTYSRPSSPSHPSHQTHHQHQYTSSSAVQAPGSIPLGVNPSPQDELAFFDRAKKALESREMYDEFLKLLNLFSREIIDARTLIQRAETFLGSGELYAQFKDLMGWDDTREGESEGPPGSIRNWTVPPTGEMEERYGKSYRRLPLAETKLACSGRDELCRGVLNDVWVSHPTWASEESGFVSHKKNSYEEALHKSEEERHEFQFYIDIITRTIALLQPLHDRILSMSSEERNAFRLPPDFGGSSQSIYHRAIKKVYGRDQQGMEVLQALQECPAVAVPVILPRLKQKNEEWRRAQREWNRVWREVDARNFYKSLDHQGITFKANDKKFITTKSSVGEIESAKMDVVERAAQVTAKRKAVRRDNAIMSLASLTESGAHRDKFNAMGGIEAEHAPHLEYTFSDLSVLQDVLKLVLSFLDRSTIQYSSHERRSVERMLRSFIPLFCMLPASEFDAAFGPPLEADTTDNEDGAQEDAAMASDDGEEMQNGPSSGKYANKSGATSGRRSVGGSNHALGNGSNGSGGGVHPSDLRKKLLKTVQEKADKARSGSASASRAVSLSGSDEEQQQQNGRQGGGASAGGESKTLTPKKGKSVRAKEVVEMQHVETEEWTRLMPVVFDTVNGRGAPEDGMDVDEKSSAVEKLASHGLVDEKPFFTNTTFYALLRLLQLLYSRLLLCKETTARQLSRDPKSSVFSVNKVAQQLGLVDAHGPNAILAVAAGVSAQQNQSTNISISHERSTNGSAQMDVTTNAAVDATPNRPEVHFYSYMLDACEKLFEGELDQATFEENMRYLFGTKAYHMFTLDKLIAALIKQVQTVVIDPKCQELLVLLSKARSKGTITMRELITYRREAEQYLGQDDHLYRIEWDQDHQVMRVWLMGNADPSINLYRFAKANASSSSLVSTTAMDASANVSVAATLASVCWRAYSESYVLTYPTELVGEMRVRPHIRRPFLMRTKEGGDDESGAGTAAAAAVPRGWASEQGLAVGVQPGTYKLLYRTSLSDAGWIRRTREEEMALQRRRRAWEERRINSYFVKWYF